MSDQHASPIKTPKQLAVVVALAFIVPITIIVLLAKYVAGHRLEGAGSSSMSPEAVSDRLKPIGSVTFSEGGGAKTLQSGEAVYNLSCAACHASGAAGAPKAGDAAAWGPRIKEGYETLVKHATEGFKAMPPKGGNADLDPIEVARAVVHMANQAGAKFKEPEAPAAAPASDAKK
jgi:cytochrome c5